MKLKEHEGKEIFYKYGIKVPKSVLVTGKNFDLKKLSEDVVFKAQVLSGGRKKAGLIKISKKNEAKNILEEFFKKNIKEVLVEEKLDIKKELYLSYVINRTKQCYTLLFSSEGGIDIEKLSLKHPEKISNYDFFEFNSKKVEKIVKNKEILNLAEKLFCIFKQYDCVLAEINPLVLTKEKNLVAADSKIIIDDNAAYRHEEFMKDMQMTESEKKAFSKNLHYVELNGNIGVIGCGAGMVMTILDMIFYSGGNPAFFLDVGAGADYARMKDAMKISFSNKKVDGIFIDIFGGMTRCDEMAKGIIEFFEENDTNIKFVIRMVGTNDLFAKKLLKDKGIICVDSMEEGVKKIIGMLK